MYTFAKMCCLCLNNKCSLINFKDCDLDNISPYDKLKHILSELVSETNNKLPPWICFNCKEELDKTYIFYKKCQKSLELLRSYNGQLQSVNDDLNLLPSTQDSYSLKIKISTINTLFENDGLSNEVSDNNVVKEELFQEDTFLFDEIIAKISSFGKEDNLEFMPIKKETPDASKKISDAEKEQIPDAETENHSVVKDEMFQIDTFLFDQIIEATSSLEKEDNQGSNPPINPIKEETDVNIETSEANKESSNVDKESSNARKESSNADKEPLNVDKETSEAVKEELSLFDEDTLPFDENSSGHNISVIKNEINDDIFNKNPEKRHFDIFRNKSALESVESDVTSITTQNNSQVNLQETNNQTESNVNESTDSNNRRRRRQRTRHIYYNEESDDEVRNFNEDSDFQPDLNVNDSMSDDNLSDNSNASDFNNQSAKRLKTNNSVSNSQTVGNYENTPNSELRVNYCHNANQKGLSSNVEPQTSTSFDKENRSVQSKTPAPAVVIHHLPQASSNTGNFNRMSGGHILPHLPQPEKSLINKTMVSQDNNQLEMLNLATNSVTNSVVVKNVLPSITSTPNNSSECNKSTKKGKTFRRKYVCNICRNKFKSSVELKEHVASHEIKEYKCKICFKLCINDNDLEVHMKEHKKSPPLTTLPTLPTLTTLPTSTTLPTLTTLTTSTTLPTLNYSFGNVKNPLFANEYQISQILASIQAPSARINTNPALQAVPQTPEIIEIKSEDDDDDYYLEKFFCNICNRKFKDFSKHMVIHQNENKAVCVYCDKTFPIKNQLFQHLRDVHCASDPVCQICKETFLNIDLLFLHMYSHYGTEVHKCPKCEQLFLHSSLMYRHMEAEHACTEFVCHKCGRQFESCKMITHHMHHHESTFATLCYYCGKGFKSKRRLTVHIDDLHGPLEDSTCKECGTKCPSRKRLRDHMDSKHGNNTYQCDVCAKFLNSRLALYVHRSRHMEDKKSYVCKECGKKFRLKFLLKNHERVHTGEKPFECKTCGKRFTQEISLVVHNRIHTGEKPYTCEDCGKSYTQSYVYKMHLKKHHSDAGLIKKSLKQK